MPTQKRAAVVEAARNEIVRRFVNKHGKNNPNHKYVEAENETVRQMTTAELLEVVS